MKITDRMKDIIITAGGKNVTPSEIENQLKFSPYISDAIVIGDKRSYLTCLVMIDQDNVVKFAQDHNVPFTNYASLCRAPEVVELIGKEVEAVNKKFARVETIKKFKLIDQLLDRRGRGAHPHHEAQALPGGEEVPRADRRHVRFGGLSRGGVGRGRCSGHSDTRTISLRATETCNMRKLSKLALSSAVCRRTRGPGTRARRRDGHRDPGRQPHRAQRAR